MRGASATGNLVQNDDSTVPRPVKHGHSQAALQGSPPGQGPGIVTTASLGAHSSEDRDSWEHLRRPTRLPLSGAPHPDNSARGTDSTPSLGYTISRYLCTPRTHRLNSQPLSNPHPPRLEGTTYRQSCPPPHGQLTLFLPDSPRGVLYSGSRHSNVAPSSTPSPYTVPKTSPQIVSLPFPLGEDTKCLVFIILTSPQPQRHCLPNSQSLHCHPQVQTWRHHFQALLYPKSSGLPPCPAPQAWIH